MAVTRAAGLIVYRQLNNAVEYLMLQTSYGKHHWTPPKGHVDEGEDEFVTALRETQEEAGLAEADLEIYLDISRTLHYDVDGKPKKVTYWLAQLKNPEQSIKLSKEHQDLRWVELAEAQKLAEFEDMKRLLQQIHNSSPIGGPECVPCSTDSGAKK